MTSAHQKYPLYHRNIPPLRPLYRFLVSLAALFPAPSDISSIIALSSSTPSPVIAENSTQVMSSKHGISVLKASIRAFSGVRLELIRLGEHDYKWYLSVNKIIYHHQIVFAWRMTHIHKLKNKCSCLLPSSR